MWYTHADWSNELGGTPINYYYSWTPSEYLRHLSTIAIEVGLHNIRQSIGPSFALLPWEPDHPHILFQLTKEADERLKNASLPVIRSSSDDSDSDFVPFSQPAVSSTFVPRVTRRTSNPAVINQANLLSEHRPKRRRLPPKRADSCGCLPGDIRDACGHCRLEDVDLDSDSESNFRVRRTYGGPHACVVCGVNSERIVAERQCGFCYHVTVLKRNGMN
jgi:hypothetical protein